MARPRSFSLDDATERAMLVFWHHGYEESGLNALLDAMGIVRGSFYKAFGSKQALFLRVLERYDAREVEAGVRLLTDDTLAGPDRIATFFSAGLDTIRRGDRRGCLLCNTASGPVLEDEDVRDAVEAQMTRLVDAFAVALEGTIADAGERLREAHRLLMQYVGLRVLGRGGCEPDVLEAALRPILDAGLGVTAPATQRLQ